MQQGKQQDVVTVFGGSGFVGSRIVAHLVANGTSMRVAVRHPVKASVSLPAGTAHHAAIVHADVCDESSVAAALENAVAAVNAVGLYVESGTETFEAVHERGAQSIACQCAAMGVPRLVHVSGIGTEIHSRSRYIKARARGEALVRQAFPAATILRPSAIFDPTDRFINTLAKVAMRTPIIPLPGDGRARLQPVFLDDVAAAVVAATQRDDATGGNYELGGPEVYTYRELYERVCQQIGMNRSMVAVPFSVWSLLATLSSVLPTPPVTQAQVELMRRDNVVSPTERSLADLGITATALSAVLSDYAFAQNL